MEVTNTNAASQNLGYSDEELERLCTVSSRFETGGAPWATWESENTSFGKTFREWAYYPKSLPLFINSDHGVHWESRCWPNEINNKYTTFFTWNSKKNDLMRENHKKKSYYVPHPWVNYRKKHFPVLPNSRSGTLVFFPHSNATTTPVYKDIDKYITDIKTLPEKHQPVVICLMEHDIHKGLHKKLRKYNIPLVTVGAVNSQSFVDRFYSLAYQFRYTSSPNIGSHTYYILEAGVPFFLFGACPEYQIKGSDAVKDGKQNLSDYGDEEDIREFLKIKTLLSAVVDEVTNEQYILASKYLGLDSRLSGLEAMLILWRELLLHIDEVALMYFKQLYRLLIKLKLSIKAR